GRTRGYRHAFGDGIPPSAPEGAAAGRYTGCRIRGREASAAGSLYGADEAGGGARQVSLNPEFRRNLWLHISWQRLFAAPTVMALAVAAFVAFFPEKTYQ